MVAMQGAVGAFIARRGRRVELSAGEPLFYQGDRSRHVYACISGRVRIFVTLPSGQELILGMKMPGEAFGELSAIDERPRSASAAAMTPSVVARMAGTDFVDELQHEPDLAFAMLRNLADELRVANARLSARNADTAYARTGQRLLELAALMVRHGADSSRIEVAITQRDLADWIGSTRESTARALSDYRRAGIVRTGRGRIVVEDLRALEDAVRSA